MTCGPLEKTRSPTRRKPVAFLRGWRRLGGILAMLGVLAILGLGQPALSSSDGDQGILVNMLQDLLSDAGREVRIRGFAGALSSRATVEQISIADTQGVWIVLSGVVIDWNRAALFDRRVEINEMSAQTIELLRMPTAPPDQNLPSPTARAPFQLPVLPVWVQIKDVSAARVILDAPVIGQPVELTLRGSAQLADGQGQASFDAHRTDGQEGSFRIFGDFDNQTRVLSLDLSLDEGPGGLAASLLNIPGRPAIGLTVQGTGPIATFAADIALSTDGQRRVGGRFALIDQSPEADLLRGGGFDIDLSGDLQPLLPAELHPFFGDQSRLHATGQRSDSGEIDLSDLSIETGAMQLSGRARIGADGLPQLVQVSAAIRSADGQPVLLPGTHGAARLGNASLTINHDSSVSRDWSLRAEIATLDLPQMSIRDSTLTGRGRLNSAPTPSAAANDPAAPVEPPFEGVFEFQALGVSADDPAVQQAIGSDFYGLLSLSWPGQGQPLDLTGLAFEGQTVSLTAHGSLDGLTFDGFAEFEAPDLSAFSGLAGRPLTGHALTTLQGKLNPLTGALDFQSDLQTRDLTVNIPQVDALLAGQVGINLSLMRDTEGTQLRALDVTAGTLHVSATGAFQPDNATVTAQMVASDLSALGAGYGGHLAVDLQLLSDSSGQRLRFDGSAIDLALGDIPAAPQIAGLMRGATRLRGDFVRHGDQTDVQLFTISGPSLTMNAAGRWSQRDPDLVLSLTRLDLGAMGPGAGGVVAGEARVTATDAGRPRYTLQLAGDGAVSTGIAQIDGLLGQGVSLNLDAQTEADGTLLVNSAALRTPALTLTAQGTQARDGEARIRIEGALDSLGRVLPGVSGAVRLSADLVHVAGQPGYATHASLSGPSGLTVNVSGRINDNFTTDLALQGQVDAEIWNPLIEPANVQGRIGFDGTLRGAPGLDALRLDARANGGRYVLPRQGVAFDNVAATAHLENGAARIHVTGESLSGGHGQIDGTISLDANRMADLTAMVDHFNISQPRLFDAQVSGQVSLTGPLAQGPTVRGTIDVLHAEIMIPNSPLARDGFRLTGLRHVAEDSASRQTRISAGIASGTRNGRAAIPMNLDLTLVAPGHIFVRGRGLDAELGGTLKLGGNTHDVVPSGSFELIRGRLDLLGNRFTLTDGSASMIGSFIPFVRLTATTDSGGVQTSVTLSGQADSPNITFSSVPELPQDEVLARLIFRRSLTTLSPFQAAQLAMSLATLTGRADNSILSRTRQAMGLDDLDFTIDEAGNTALRAGRYISDHVYTDVRIDNTGRSEVTINLDVTPNVTLRGHADSNGGSGVGLFYERDY